MQIRIEPGDEGVFRAQACLESVRQIARLYESDAYSSWPLRSCWIAWDAGMVLFNFQHYLDVRGEYRTTAVFPNQLRFVAAPTLLDTVAHAAGVEHTPERLKALARRLFDRAAGNEPAHPPLIRLPASTPAHRGPAGRMLHELVAS